MIKKFLATAFFIVASLGLFAKVYPDYLPVFAQEEDEQTAVEEQEEKLEELAGEIEELEEKINELQGRRQTLQNEIAYFDSQINLTELRIQNAVAEINKRQRILENLIDDIGELENRIVQTSESIDYQEDVLDERMRARYKSQSLSPVLYMLNSDSFSTAIKRIKYLKTLQYQDQQLLDEMRKAREAYNQQKGILQDKREETEQLKANVEAEKANLVAYQAELDDQKAAKQNLLEQTQNSEERYQELLEAARRELRQIQGAANVVIREGQGVDVDEGEIIGTMGNSGFSTGPHLHFSVYRYSVEDFQSQEDWDWYYSNYRNPADYLEEESVLWATGCGYDPSGYKETGDGDWRWPMSNPIRITQNYGDNTCYNWQYNYKPHPALDIVGEGSLSIRAVDDGEAYFCRNCLGDGGNGVFVFHDDDYMTLYWHLQ